jgi:hypothetical protein
MKKPEAVPMIAEPYGHSETEENYMDKPVKSHITVTEMGSRTRSLE